MADSKINGLTALTDSQVEDSTRLLAIAHPTTGIAGKGTVGQLRSAVSVKKEKYTASGSEGPTITIAALLGKEILMITREGGVLYEVDTDPDSVEFIWDGTDITLGLDVQFAGERFLILYKNV